MKILNEKIRSIQPEKQKIVTISEVKNYLKIDHDYDDKLIGTLINGAIGIVEGILCKKIIKSNVIYNATLLFDDGEISDINCYGNRNKNLRINTMIKDGIRTDYLYVGSKKISHDGYALTVEEYDFQKLIIQNSAFIGNIKDNKVEITLSLFAGLFDTVDDVDPVIKTAIMMQVAELYDNRDYSYIKPKSIRKILRQILSYYINYQII